MRAECRTIQSKRGVVSKIYGHGRDRMRGIMNKIDFMRQLEDLLQNISAAEREEALQYYNDYFEEAGIENEQQVIGELGSPAQVAANIRRELFGTGRGEGVNTNTPATLNVTYSNHGSENMDDNSSMAGRGASAEYMTETAASAQTSEKSGFPGWAIALIVILIIFSSPVLLGIAGTLLGILVAWFALIFSAGVLTVTMLVMFVFFVGLGIAGFFVSPWVGISVIGMGLLFGGIGILALMLTVLMAGIITPAVCRGIGFLFRKKKA